VGEWDAVGSGDLDVVAVDESEGEAVLVDASVVASEDNEVVEAGVAAVCPVDDVVGVDVAAVVAAREAASAVAYL